MITSGAGMSGPLHAVGAPEPTGGVGPVSPVAPASGVAPADGLAVSGGSEQMAGWLSALRALPDVRSERVAEIAARLQNGQQPSAADLAARLLSQALPPAGSGG